MSFQETCEEETGMKTIQEEIHWSNWEEKHSLEKCYLRRNWSNSK